jgi:O-antigen/teichoic acid export membrane protein
VITLMVAPRFARLHARGDGNGLQQALTSATRAALLSASAVTASIVLLSPTFGWLLGARFPDIRLPLLVIVVGQLVNAAAGPLATVLKMTGHERDVRNALLLGLGCSLALSLALIGPMGAVGAALAASLSTITWNAVLFKCVRSRLRIGGGPLAREAT